MTHIKHLCPDCKRLLNHLYHFQDKMICKLCLRKVDTLMPMAETKEEIEAKPRTVYPKGGQGVIYVPASLIGKQVKVVLLDSSHKTKSPMEVN